MILDPKRVRRIWFSGSYSPSGRERTEIKAEIEVAQEAGKLYSPLEGGQIVFWMDVGVPIAGRAIVEYQLATYERPLERLHTLEYKLLHYDNKPKPGLTKVLQIGSEEIIEGELIG